MPTVSVIMPTFNRAKFLPQAVGSVLSQSYADLELIIIDDGSTDDTVKVLAPFLNDDRVRYFHQENRGQSKARNVGLNQASGEFIAFLDSDDTWATEKLKKQVALISRLPGAAIVHGDEETVNEKGEVISFDNMKRYSGRITRQLLADNSVSITTALVRRKCFDEMGGFQASHGVADDYDLWLRFSARYLFHYEPGIVASYRVMEDQISSDKRRRFAANEMIIRNFLNQYGDSVTPREKRWGLARFYCRSARYFASVGERKKAARDIVRAFSNAPMDSVVWRALFRILVPQK
ncbi:glycosyltransferase [Marinobacter confluentis]|uniref:Glycosyltransferase n=1 Tax=Marinobacter confluentis TaxID=1697557 RepID=A0A4Z1C2P0_9GAMM|nr:glycosyltransferase [Marinobacter confluentis]TGN41528.1 glycosyltransferase [Marinobacter confluentis]